ncbi:hypothetical protein EHW99_0017 [Erwinia amylovora]|uniref:Uncharacterized protein n=2 Tax=Erwinia amylovora TaxID=552 RepID=A0A831A258_ERWAM|nr:hypothetical protein EaACW_0019 [Erwinia amylovora ACW56400]QJQ52724.1 hypothetical protein EHX00_0017 [Erwinia amylovora]CBA18959.1 hypothetical protein predicted by Glimmer/Critica [Erwinia amylovora CFBP1430]CCO76867.1 hypothetical protein BN432_0019 [Erwinia amylovora Ea356]CCO80643.1 hypothetical protein BN433_0021 [Erwinia amylovora Ea266]CCO84458.1 hypothetical protein BN434_0019 [Erwinia amylovora CFBP 2585]CCO88241.1 hypothetical protein BN435_0018 [Erwinia amylovora 01SFR-BO]CCO
MSLKKQPAARQQNVSMAITFPTSEDCFPPAISYTARWRNVSLWSEK